MTTPSIAVAPKLRVIDADAHWDENPTDMWQRRIPRELHDGLPVVVKNEAGVEFLSYASGKVKVPIRLGTGVVGAEPNPEMNPKERSSINLVPQVADPIAQRIADMETDGVHAAVLYSLNGAALNRAYAQDPRTVRAYIRAYNDWLAEEVCAPSGNRIHAMAIQPWTGAKDVVAELEHAVRQGMKGINLGRWPNGSQLPDESDDYFWSAAQEMGVPVSIHVVNDFVQGNIDFSGRLKNQQRDQLSLGAVNTSGASSIPIVDVMLGQGIPERFPKLKIGLIEANIGWIPNYLVQADYYWMRYRYTVGKNHFRMLPSEQFRQCFHASFLYDPFGVENRAAIGLDRIMWSTDFPHGITEWPLSRRQAAELFKGVPESEVRMMVHDNACRFYNLDP
ncbi:MAG: amidohydrolase family protein [Gammaproteobacteria bacterium]